MQDESEMCFEEKSYTDALRHNMAQMACSATGVSDDTGDGEEIDFEPVSDTSEDELELAVEAKKRDNLLIGETLVSIGLLHNHELLHLNSAQTEGNDVVGSLLVASAIRSRLGEILLSAKFITSSQLEHALEVQRESGGLLGEILVGLEWLEREKLDAALAAQAQHKAAA